MNNLQIPEGLAPQTRVALAHGRIAVIPHSLKPAVQAYAVELCMQFNGDSELPQVLEMMGCTVISNARLVVGSWATGYRMVA